MKVTCKQKDLLNGLAIVGRAVSTKSTLPILSCVRVVTEKSRLKLSTTNLEIAITCWVDAKVHEEGVAAIPAKLLTDFVGSLPGVPVEIQMGEGQTVAIESLRSKAIIYCMNAEEFPAIPTVEGSEGSIVTVDAALLKEMIADVTFAASTDDSRPVLTGVLVRLAEQRLTLAASNGFCLAVREVKLENAEERQIDLIVPVKTLIELERLLPNEGVVEMAVPPGRGQVLFHAQHMDLLSRLIEGVYPNIQSVLPEESTTQVTIETREFAAAIKAVAPFATSTSNISHVRIENQESVEGEKGKLTIQATAEDIGDNESFISVTVNGPSQDMYLNVKYLSDILAVIGAPEIAVEIVSKTRPCIIKPVVDPDATFVIMPMTMNS